MPSVGLFVDPFKAVHNALTSPDSAPRRSAGTRQHHWMLLGVLPFAGVFPVSLSTVTVR
jgi:hypothetical protein